MPTEPTDREVRDAITADRTWASGYAAGRAAALGPDSELRRLRSEFAEAADRWEAAADEARKGNHRSSFAGETDLPAHVLSRTRMLVFRHVVESIDAALTDSRPDSIDAAGTEGRIDYIPLLAEAMQEAAEKKTAGAVYVSHDDAWSLMLALSRRHLGLISDAAHLAEESHATDD